MAIHEIQVTQVDQDPLGREVLHEAERTIGDGKITGVTTSKKYTIEGDSLEDTQKIARLVTDPINQRSTIDEPVLDTTHTVEVAYKPGVMNPAVGSLEDAAEELDIHLAAADVSTVYSFEGDVSSEDIDQVVSANLVNKIVQEVVRKKRDTLLITGEVGPINTVLILTASESELMALSKDKLFLNLEEMKVIQQYFQELGRDPRDAELEAIAGRWSEHCGHKTFKAEVVVDGVVKPPLFTRIKKAAEQYFGDEVISAFEDNSGVIRLYDGQAYCGKVETHNSPSAIEPRGGAMTGSGGVFRDILGTGQGAEPDASTDIFCFAPPDLDPSKLPAGTLNPRYLLEKVVAGVRDYGNRMGIPTNNGSVHFHEDFRAKPSVIVGSYGIIPEEKAQKGVPEIGDLVVAIGGRTGRDGIHGATFSSGEMTDRTISVNSSAVQIGDAIQEKKMTDAIIEARDNDLIRAITDCGAAGFSSAIGEMGENIGVNVDISKAPTKYSGLDPWEIWMSESQERMVLAVDPNKIPNFLKVCQRHGVEATVLGNFDGSKKLTVTYGDQSLVDLDYDFLQNGLPQRRMIAHWEKTQYEEILPNEPRDYIAALKNVLSHGNVCSKEPIVRQYDHGVQGTNVLPPFSGVHHDGPNDAIVLTPILDKPYGMVLSHGMNPILNRIDPRHGSIWAVTEAMSNYVAVGGNPDTAALINNYIWPFPTEAAMGSLDMSVDAVVESMHALQRPVISGKDSLSSTYRGKDGQVIEIPPVLCISVFGKIPDVEKTVTADIKKIGTSLYLVGALDSGMAGSTYYDTLGIVGNEVPKVDLQILPNVLRGIHESIQTGQVAACHDISEGGLITAVTEMAFGGDCGVELTLDENTQRADLLLFNETAGIFIVEVDNDEIAAQLFGALPYMAIGKTTEKKEIVVNIGHNNLFAAGTDELKHAWQEPMRRIFS